MDGKAENKLALLGEVKLPSDTDRPVVGVIMNFDEFQGAGLIASSLKSWPQWIFSWLSAARATRNMRNSSGNC